MDKSSQNNDQRRLYSDLAWLWDIVSPLDEYLDETETFVDILNKWSELPMETMLHLGSGRGQNDYVFKDYFEVTGVDISSTMIDTAKKLNPEVDYQLGDIRKIRLGKKFDVVTGVDSFDYLTNYDDLKATFVTAYEHLKKGGLLMFILETTKESFIQNDIITHSNERDDEMLTVVENRFDPDPDDDNFELTYVYLYRKNGKLEIYNDRHLCGLFEEDKVIEMLQETGFEVVVENYEPPEATFGGAELFAVDVYPMFVCKKV